MDYESGTTIIQRGEAGKRSYHQLNEMNTHASKRIARTRIGTLLSGNVLGIIQNSAYRHGCIIDSVSCWQTGRHCFIYFACGQPRRYLSAQSYIFMWSFISRLSVSDTGKVYSVCPNLPHPTFRVIIIQSNRCQKGTAEVLLYV